MTRHVAFVTIGEAPRPELVAGITRHLAAPPAITEFGALDELDDGAIRAMAPADGEERLVTQRRDAREVVVAKAAMQRRLEHLFAAVDGRGFDLIVLLCTGHFAPFALRTPLLEAQSVVDHFTDGLTYGVATLGVMVPHPEQCAGFHGIGDKRIRATHASPYAAPRFTEAARELRDTDAVVMHCMGYDAAMQREVAAVTGRPVLLARRLVASAVALMTE
jgi:protein AroM